MRLLLLFVVLVVLVSGGVATINRIVDPADEFYSGAPLTAALESKPPCLLADEIVGSASYPEFKQDLFRRRRARTVILGSSRVLKIGAHPGETRFVNLGFPEISPGPLLDMMGFLARETPERRRLTIYVATDFFWFNPNAPFIDEPPFDKSFFDRIGYLFSRNTFRSTWNLIRTSNTLAFRGWRRERIGRYCVVDRGTPYRNWRADGTRVYSFELAKGIPRPRLSDTTTDLATLRAGLYANWHEFAWDRLTLLDRALGIAAERRWEVVGFSPPDSTRFARLFASKLPKMWEIYGREMPAVFAKHGFEYLDWRDVRDVPCRQSAFVDDGYHTDARCSRRMRLKLDAAARS